MSPFESSYQKARKTVEERVEALQITQPSKVDQEILLSLVDALETKDNTHSLTKLTQKYNQSPAAEKNNATKVLMRAIVHLHYKKNLQNNKK